MQKDDAQSESIIKLLVNNEKAASRLYKKFSTLFENSDFWLDLSKDEENHAKWLNKIFHSKSEFSISESFSSDIILHTTQKIEKIIDNITEDKTTKEALNASLVIERSFIEKNFFDVFQSDSKEFNQAISLLREETKQHIHKIEKELLLLGYN